MKKQFTCAVSMAVPSEEQFNNDILQNFFTK